MYIDGLVSIPRRLFLSPKIRSFHRYRYRHTIKYITTSCFSKVVWRPMGCNNTYNTICFMDILLIPYRQTILVLRRK